MLLICVFIIAALTAAIPGEVLGIDENPYLSTVILQLIIYAIPALLFCTLRGVGYASKLRIRFSSLSSILLMISALVLMLAGSGLINYFVSTVAPESMASSSSAESAAFAMNSGVFDGLYLALAFAVLPAITEEFLFRGIMLTEYSSLGAVCAVVISSVMFSLSHFSIPRLPSYFFCGIVLAILTFATRSVLAPMLVHAGYNIIVLFFEQYVLHVAEKQNISSILFIIIAVVIAFASAAAFSFEASSLYRGYAADNVPCDYVPKKKPSIAGSLAEAVFSPSFIALAVTYVIIILIRR